MTYLGKKHELTILLAEIRLIRNTLKSHSIESKYTVYIGKLSAQRKNQFSKFQSMNTKYQTFNALKLKLI